MYKIVKDFESDEFKSEIESYINSSTLFDKDIANVVTDIVDDVISNGDEVVKKYTK